MFISLLIKMSLDSKFIVFEGLDGCGKSTALFKCADWLFSKDKRYFNLLVTREPTFNSIGSQIRSRLASDSNSFANPEVYARLFSDDRALHLSEDILPALNKNYFVFCDRYFYSTIAYQSAQGLPIQRAIDLNSCFRVPDLVLFFKVSPETAISRIYSRGSLADKNVKFEKLDFLSKTAIKFEEAFEMLNHNVAFIDAEQSIDSVFSQSKSILEKVLPY